MESISRLHDQVLMSGEKAKFIANQLPQLIRDNYFWMDILYIDQCNKAAKVAVMQYIPTIFLSTYKTLVIRECGRL